MWAASPTTSLSWRTRTASLRRWRTIALRCRMPHCRIVSNPILTCVPQQAAAQLDKVHSLGKDKIHGWKIKVRKEFSDVVPRIAYAIFRAVDELEMMPDGQYRAGVLHVLPIRSASNEGEDAGARPTIFDGA
eukprot:4448342-Prymnesium_polylepis.1